MKQIIGLNKTNKWYITKQLWKVCKAVWTDSTVKNISYCLRQLGNIIWVLEQGLAPSKELMQEEVAKRPYAPFGVDGLTNTTTYDGNLAQQFSAQEKK